MALRMRGSVLIMPSLTGSACSSRSRSTNGGSMSSCRLSYAGHDRRRSITSPCTTDTHEQPSNGEVSVARGVQLGVGCARRRGMGVSVLLFRSLGQPGAPLNTPGATYDKTWVQDATRFWLCVREEQPSRTRRGGQRGWMMGWFRTLPWPKN
jgi:hypothetical protein